MIWFHVKSFKNLKAILEITDKAALLGQGCSGMDTCFSSVDFRLEFTLIRLSSRQVLQLSIAGSGAFVIVKVTFLILPLWCT